MRNRELLTAYLIGVIAIVAAIIYAVSSFQNVVSQDTRRIAQTVNALFAEHHRTVKTMAYDYSFWDTTIQKGLLEKDTQWATDNIGDYLIETFELDNTFLFDEAGNTVHAFGEGAEIIRDRLFANKDFLRAKAETINRVTTQPKPSGFYLKFEDHFYFGAVSALTYENSEGARKPEEKAYLVLVKQISDEFLEQVAENFVIPGLSYQSDEANSSVVVLDDKGRKVMTLHYIDHHNFWTDSGWNLMALFLSVTALMYLISIIQHKSRQTEQLNDDLQIANERLSHFNDELAKKVQEQTQEITHKAEKAEEASKAKSVFLSSMSHEFRTPLNGIIGFSQMLKMNSQKNLKAKELEWADQITKSGTMLLKLVNDVLDLARIESGRIEKHPETFQPREVFKECYDVILPLAEQNEISVSGRPETESYVFVDRAMMERVLMNLIGNAVKYGKKGGFVHFGCRDFTDDTIEIYVRDNGIGIPGEDLPHIFEPFHRSRQLGSKIEGTGVGLSIVKRNVESMGGTISVESEPGHGTCFKVFLPSVKNQE